MSNGPEEIWSKIVKYSSVANGTALTLTLSTIGKSPLVQLNATIGKAPVWCFFIGLFASGLHLFFSFYFHVELARTEGMKKLGNRIEQLKVIRHDALSIGRIKIEIATELAELERYKAFIDKFDFGHHGDHVLSGLRNAQEILLWTSYILFFAGVFVVVWSV